LATIRCRLSKSAWTEKNRIDRFAVAAVSDRRLELASIGDRRYSAIYDRQIVAAVSDRRLVLASIGDRRYSNHRSEIDATTGNYMTFKPRLRRLDWLYTQCPIYYLTLCTQNRRRSLANAAIHQEFTIFAERATDFHVLVGLYMIMPDHIHLFAAFSPQSPDLWKWVKALRGDLSRLLREDEGEGTHWEKDFFDHVMRSEESYWEKMEYVRQNPVRAGLVPRPEDWPYQGEIHRLVYTKL